MKRGSKEATHGRPDFWNSGLKKGSKASRNKGPEFSNSEIKAQQQRLKTSEIGIPEWRN
jgi:hypothetical protein